MKDINKLKELIMEDLNSMQSTREEILTKMKDIYDNDDDSKELMRQLLCTNILISYVEDIIKRSEETNIE